MEKRFAGFNAGKSELESGFGLPAGLRYFQAFSFNSWAFDAFLGSECRYGFVLQLFFERPDLIRHIIGGIWAEIHPLLLSEKQSPSRLLRAFLTL